MFLKLNYAVHLPKHYRPEEIDKSPDWCDTTNLFFQSYCSKQKLWNRDEDILCIFREFLGFTSFFNDFSSIFKNTSLEDYFNFSIILSELFIKTLKSEKNILRIFSEFACKVLAPKIYRYSLLILLVFSEKYFLWHLVRWLLQFLAGKHAASKKPLRGCSYENSFPVVFPLNREKDIISSCSYTKYSPAWARFILASC